jgi:hypothetical protein
LAPPSTTLQFVTGEDVDGRPAPAMTVWRAPALQSPGTCATIGIAFPCSLHQSRAPEWLVEFMLCLGAGHADISEHMVIECSQTPAGSPTPPCHAHRSQRRRRCRLLRPVVACRRRRCPIVARSSIRGTAQECRCRHGETPSVEVDTKDGLPLLTSCCQQAAADLITTACRLAYGIVEVTRTPTCAMTAARLLARIEAR